MRLVVFCGLFALLVSAQASRAFKILGDAPEDDGQDKADDDEFDEDSHEHSGKLGDGHFGLGEHGSLDLWAGSGEGANFVRIKLDEVVEVYTDTDGNVVEVLKGDIKSDGAKWAAGDTDAATGRTTYTFESFVKLEDVEDDAVCSCNNCEEVPLTITADSYSKNFSVDYAGGVVSGLAGTVKVSFEFGCWPFTNGTALWMGLEVKAKGDTVDLNGDIVTAGAGVFNLQSVAIADDVNVQDVTIVVSYDDKEFRNDEDHNDDGGDEDGFENRHDGRDNNDGEDHEDGHHDDHDDQDWSKELEAKVWLVFPTFASKLYYDPVVGLNTGAAADACVGECASGVNALATTSLMATAIALVIYRL